LSRHIWGDSLESNIQSFKTGLDNDRELEKIKQRLDNLEHTAFGEFNPGTAKKAAKSTGSKRKKAVV